MSNSAQTSSRKRIKALLDDNSFVEVGGYITARATDFNMTAQETPADGVVTGYGTIDGNLVYVYSQDAAVLGGSVGEMHAKKIAGLYDLAMKMGAPVIGLVDCAGLRLQEAVDALNGFGQIYLCQTMASGVIPQITALFGGWRGGLGGRTSSSHFGFIEGKKGKLFVNSPNALDGNYTAKCDTASAAFQSAEAGLVDLVGEESEILEQIRTLIAILPANNEDDMSYDECNDDLNRLCPELASYSGDAASALAAVSDENFFMEFKKDYAPEMVTGFIRLNGNTVGCVANAVSDPKKSPAPVLTVNGCEKAADFVNFCDAFNIPVLTLADVKGYQADKESEKKIAKAAGRLTYAYANATVPKVTVVTGQAYGTAYLTMCSKALGADIVYAWDKASIGMMDPSAAVKIMYAKEIETAEDAPALIAEKAAAYGKEQSSAQAAARRGYVDDIIAPADTRKRVAAALEMLFTKREDRPDKKHGTV